MLRQPTANPPPLDYYRSSPVRGQLEPWDPTTAKGWRYLQTTDTLNEFKVLLPPRTALMYEQLLKLEAIELGKGSSLSWQRVLEIRHLKDRMIRKCHRLPGASSHRKLGRTGAFAFQTIVAPADFRLKEMEKWFKHLQRSADAVLKRHNATHPDGVDSCSKCASTKPSSARHIEGLKVNSKHRSSSSTKALPAPITSTPEVEAIPASSPTSAPAPTTILPMPVPAPSTPLPAPDPTPLPVLVTVLPVGASTPHSVRSKSRISKASNSVIVASPPPSLAPSSPPLPHPYRHQHLRRVSLDDASNASKDDHSRKRTGTITGTPLTSDPLETVTEEDKVGEMPTIRPRRRSCIKRSSISDLAKTVSWADNHELEEVLSSQTSDARWQEIRELCTQQMMGLQAFHSQVVQNLEQLRAEVAQLENIDTAIRTQRETMQQTITGLEETHATFEQKMCEVLKATNRMTLTPGVSAAPPQ
ncbi:hypothetical protein AX16_009556 [Volvariella volvacea WC 439]|nr:hypothetical protein AX16_009556 [Volvariella volvacea WC 439]